MDIYIHDTLTGTKRRFEPRIPDTVSMYVCGPTVYNLAHIGNALPEVAFDVLARVLRLYFKHVTHIHNITDIDDKINAAALANGEPIRALTDRFVGEYRADIAALGVLEPDVRPRATEHISEIIDMIETLIDRGHAYEAERARAVPRAIGPELRKPFETVAARHSRRRARGSRRHTSAIPRTSCSGNPRATTCPAGTAPGDAAGPAGTSSARR